MIVKGEERLPPAAALFLKFDTLGMSRNVTVFMRREKENG